MLSVLLIVLEKYLMLRVGPGILFHLEPAPAQVRAALRFRGFPTHILPFRIGESSFRGFFVFCAPFWSHRNWESNLTAELYVLLQLIYLAFSARQIQFGSFFLPVVPCRYPEQTSHVQSKTAEDVSTLGFYWYRVEGRRSV